MSGLKALQEAKARKGQREFKVFPDKTGRPGRKEVKGSQGLPEVKEFKGQLELREIPGRLARTPSAEFAKWRTYDIMRGASEKAGSNLTCSDQSQNLVMGGSEVAIPQYTAEELAAEVWRAVVEYEGWYSVSNIARVRRDKAGQGTQSGRIRKPSLDKDGYLKVDLFRDGIGKTFRVHCLVMRSFVGPAPEGQETNHKDGDKGNGRLSNLEYRTHRGNVDHAVENGLCPSGESCGSAKYRDAEIEFAELLLRLGLPTRCVATITEIGLTTVKRVRRSEGRKAQSGHGFLNENSSVKYSDEEISEAERLLRLKLSTRQVAKLTGIVLSVVKRIRRSEARIAQAGNGVLNDNPPNNTKYSLTEINKAIELLATGLSTHKVAAQTGISVTHVKRIRRGEARVSQQCQSVPPSISST